MPAESKSQQRFFGMVSAYKSGELDLGKIPESLRKKIRKAAGDMSDKQVDDYASTKHKGLPEKLGMKHQSKQTEKILNTFISKKMPEKVEEALVDISGGYSPKPPKTPEMEKLDTNYTGNKSKKMTAPNMNTLNPTAGINPAAKMRYGIK